MIEVEIRGMLTKEQFDTLTDSLAKLADSFEQDDKESCFFIVPGKNLKVTKNISNGSAKIALKTGEVSQTANKEIEVKIHPEDYENVIDTFQALGFNNTIYSKQTRTNYIYCGIEIAAKYSDDWGYHYEAEIMVEDESEIAEAEKKLHSLAKELGLPVLTPEDHEILIKKINSQRSSG